MHSQVGCLRIGSLNTSQSDGMTEKSKVVFPGVEEYISFFLIFLSK